MRRQQPGEVFLRVWRLAIVLALAGSLSLAWSPVAAQPARFDVAEARRALNEGRYADVARLLAGAPADDPAAAVLKARALGATGRFQEAEAALRPAASRHPVGDATLELGLLLQRIGRTDEARRILVPLAAVVDSGDAADLLRAGRAARAIGAYEQANDALREAAKRAPNDAATNTAWGGLFLEKYNQDEAATCFKAALAADPRDVDALLGFARSSAEDDLATALGAVRHALEINPSSADAHVLLGAYLLDAGYPDAARQSLDRAVAINGKSLEAHALQAAIASLDNRAADFEREIATVLAVNASYGEAYRIVAAALAHHYRFDDAAAMARKAVALDPHNARALADLGLDLLRTGDEDGARAALKQGFDLDPYNLVTYNLLQVLDALAKFDTFRDGDLIVRIDHAGSAVLKDPVIALAHDALRALSAKYEFTPRGPVLIEVFAHHDDFAVRNLGIPGLAGALGACFGRVVTMDSPRARPPGTFEWGATLWHELTHVITLQMSNQRVPRWLTEGISVYEEQRARAEWRRPLEDAFVGALAADEVPAIRDLEGNFADPKTIGLAYYQAGLVVGYIVDTYGQAKLNALIRAFADGTGTDAAFTRALGANLDRLQAGFAQSLERSFGPLRRALTPDVTAGLEDAPVDRLQALAVQHPASYQVQMALGLALRKQGDTDGAAKALGRAAELFPTAVGDDTPHAVLGEMALERGDRAAALAEMDKRLAADTVNVELARRMVGLVGEDEDPAQVEHAYKRIAAVDPFDARAQAMLGRIAMKRGDAAAAIGAFRAALAAGPDDRAAVGCDLAEAYLVSGDPAQAKRETVAVLEGAPSYERAQELLLRIVGGEK